MELASRVYQSVSDDSFRSNVKALFNHLTDRDITLPEFFIQLRDSGYSAVSIFKAQTTPTRHKISDTLYLPRLTGDSSMDYRLISGLREYITRVYEAKAKDEMTQICSAMETVQMSDKYIVEFVYPRYRGQWDPEDFADYNFNEAMLQFEHNDIHVLGYTSFPWKDNYMFYFAVDGQEEIDNILSMSFNNVEMMKQELNSERIKRIHNMINKTDKMEE